LIAAPVLACLVVVYEPFFDPHQPKGFAVDLASVQCEVGERVLVLHVTDTGKLFLNMEQEEWRNLPGRLVDIYGPRADRTIYLLADEGVGYQTVMDAMDVVEGAAMPDGERIRILLTTPKGRCPVPTTFVRGRAVP
jgi:biopolymer transport protein ExbD